MPKCKYKHTKFNPTGEDWKCPACGESSGYFYISNYVNIDCEELHVEDCVRCYKCDSKWSGEEVAAVMLKRSNQKSCPHCKGTGVVDA